jgi:hypothetical protein
MEESLHVSPRYTSVIDHWYRLCYEISDYRGLKKHIKAIHRAQQPGHDPDVHPRPHSPPTASSSRASIGKVHPSPAQEHGHEHSPSVSASHVATIKPDHKVVIPPAPIPPLRKMSDQSPLDQFDVQASRDVPVFGRSTSPEAEGEETDKVPGLRPSLSSKTSARRWISRKKSGSTTRGTSSCSSSLLYFLPLTTLFLCISRYYLPNPSPSPPPPPLSLPNRTGLLHNPRCRTRQN